MSSVEQVAGRLSQNGLAALRKLRRSEFGGAVVQADAEHLLRLGLAELNYGSLALTGLGRRVAEQTR